MFTTKFYDKTQPEAGPTQRGPRHRWLRVPRPTVVNVLLALQIQIPNSDFKTDLGLVAGLSGGVLQISISEFKNALAQRRYCILECRHAQAGVKFQRDDFNFKKRPRFPDSELQPLRTSVEV